MLSPCTVIQLTQENQVYESHMHQSLEGEEAAMEDKLILVTEPSTFVDDTPTNDKKGHVVPHYTEVKKLKKPEKSTEDYNKLMHTPESDHLAPTTPTVSTAPDGYSFFNKDAPPPVPPPLSEANLLQIEVVAGGGVVGGAEGEGGINDVVYYNDMAALRATGGGGTGPSIDSGQQDMYANC